MKTKIFAIVNLFQDNVMQFPAIAKQVWDDEKVII